ncbi:hypothetical protein EOA38_29410 [Mesorhizobium sp. M1E.F.Ca.ET.041.01.1.1]|nr:hypothetical protein EOA38_29410 [Mesorhizobium sp. M1E.F.Ca.ET.041.01.1.1]
MQIQAVEAIVFPSPRFFQHPSSVSALRADPPSPTRGEGKGASASKMTNNSLCLASKAFLSLRDRNRSI